MNFGGTPSSTANNLYLAKTFGSVATHRHIHKQSNGVWWSNGQIDGALVAS
jgi:hypothetical protein